VVVIDKKVGHNPNDIEWEKIQLLIWTHKLPMPDNISRLKFRFQLGDLSVTLDGEVIEPENIGILRSVIRPGVEAVLSYLHEGTVEETVVKLIPQEVEAIRTVLDFYSFWAM
jgi:hypothetical protein